MLQFKKKMNPFHSLRIVVLKLLEEKDYTNSFVYCLCTQAHSLLSGKGMMEVISAIGSSWPALCFVVALLFVLAELLNFSLLAVPFMALAYVLKPAETASMIDNLQSHALPSTEHLYLLLSVCVGAAFLRLIIALLFSTTKKVAEKRATTAEIAALALALERSSEAAILGRRRLHSMESPLPQPKPGDLRQRDGVRERKKVSRSSSSYARII